MSPHCQRMRSVFANLLLLAGTCSATAEQLFFARDRTITSYETTTDALGSTVSILGLAVAPSPEIPVSGLYRIDGGRFQVCCGLLGPMNFPLPSAEQQYIALSVAPNGGAASMRLLGEDEKTVFALEGGGLRGDFVYDLQDGRMSLHSLVFDSPPSLKPDKTSYAYAVQFTDTGLTLRGSVRVPCVFCADFPEDFGHSDVSATLVIAAPLIQSFHRSNDTVTFTFTGEPGYDYFVEYSTTLPAVQWKLLTQFRSKLVVIEPEVTDTISDNSMRAYRIRKQPCLCR